MGTPPVSCVGRTQGATWADTGDLATDTGELWEDRGWTGDVLGQYVIENEYFLYIFRVAASRAFGAHYNNYNILFYIN